MKPYPFFPLFLACVIALFTVGASLADDGEMFRRDVSNTPELETEHAAVRMLPLYVPMQSSDGTLLEDGIEYYDADGGLVETRLHARPLISHYTDGHVEFIEEEAYGGFPGHGERDAYGAVSLDDGATWKRTNLSKSGDQSSFKIKLGGKKKVAYPGDVGRSFAASDGNKVLIVWVSRYARGGNPNYAMALDELEVVAQLLEDRGTIPDAAACVDEDLIETPCLYFEDHFSVAGSQGSSDLADEELPLIGELPYAAVWAARGVILPPEATGLETNSFVWFKAERLSSAVRDANRPEAVCVNGAGCVVTWQEDPDGIRPGHGDGPGEGWSGAIAHHQTDTWYSYIDWDDFELVVSDEEGTYGSLYDGTGDLAAWVAANDTGNPKAAIPLAIPVRLTDNAMCVAEGDKPYCYADFDASGTPDFCADSVAVTMESPEGPTSAVEMCITEDGRLMRGNTAATRARLGLRGYSSLGDYSADPVTYPIDSAWFSMAYEENKGLGDEGEDEVTAEDLIDKVDMGKNVWYHTFDMFKPELVSQGLMLNQPAAYEDDFANPDGFLTADSSLGYNFYTIVPDPIYETQASLESTLYQTEIARRPSPISQDWYDAGESGLVALQLWKQGIVRRGGPADIFGRRFVMHGDGEPTPDSYKLCTTSYQLCTTTYDWCEGCIATVENLLYDYNKGQCKKNPDQPRCFEYYYIDEGTGDTIYTNEEEICPSEPVCHYDQPECPVGMECEETTSCGGELLPSCPVGELCEDTTSCEMVDNCDGPFGDNQVCTTIPGSDGGFDPAVDNPYDYTNMVCENADGSDAWAYTDGTNPRYVKGFCAAPAINLSGNTILTGESCADATACLEAFPFNDYFDDIDMTDSEPISKIFTWEQYGPDYGTTVADTTETNFDDMSWENPYDVAKGHRGFMAGDMVMVMYAWSPNWKALTYANAPFNLYNRRSFDGGLTWSTLPGSFTHTNDETYSGDGTTTCEFMVESDARIAVCTDYGAGEFEQARNVSQLVGRQVTVLDPRYSPTTRSITPDSVSTDSLPVGFSAPEYLDDTRDPSRYFMVYETGETSAYDAGEAPPLDLFYSRAIDWGDDYLVWQDEATELCVPSADDGDDYDMQGFCNEFDALEGKNFLESGEASITASPGGQFLYSIWNQGELDGEEVIASDAIFRRVLFLDDYVLEVPETNN